MFLFQLCDRKTCTRKKINDKVAHWFYTTWKTKFSNVLVTRTRHGSARADKAHSARADKAQLSTYRTTQAKHVKRSNGASFRISLMQPYLFLSRDGVDGVHALAKCVRCLHACCTDAHPGSWCRGAVLLREDGWLRRRHWLPALALEGRWRGGRRRRRQWRRQVASS